MSDCVGAELESITISKLVKDSFYATVLIKRGRTVAEVDARPCDAINLALRANAPLVADEQVLEQAAKRARLTKKARTGSAALIAHYEEHDRLANTPIGKAEAARVQGVWQEHGVVFLDD